MIRRRKGGNVLALLAVAAGVFARAGETVPAADKRLGAIYEQASRALLRVEFTLSSGKERYLGEQPALLLDTKGLVLTSGALRRAGTKLDIVTVRVPASGKRIDARYIGKDEDTDLAFLRVDPASLPADMQPVRFAPPAGEARPAPLLRPGTSVAAVGLLEGEYAHLPFLRTGRIMADVSAPLPQVVTDIPAAGNLSCAPLFDFAGNVIGLVVPSGAVSMVATGTAQAYAAPLVARLASNPPEEARERERQHGWLGILMGALSKPLARHWGLEVDGGVVVNQVFEDSPAAAAGLREGDIIVAFDGKPVTLSRDEELQSFVRLVKSTPTGREVMVKVLRNDTGAAAGEEEGALPPPVFAARTVPITLGVRPMSALYERTFRDTLLGMTLKDITVQDRVNYHLDDAVEGVLVLQVEDGSWALLAQLEPGDILARVDETPLNNLQDYILATRKALEKETPALLFLVHRDGGTVFRVLRPHR